jgi:hypothetical protein
MNVLRNFLKETKGSITLFVLVAMIFFLAVISTAYASVSNDLQDEYANQKRIQAAYEEGLDEESLDALYNEKVNANN